jgi:hypothetical protein
LGSGEHFFQLVFDFVQHLSVLSLFRNHFFNRNLSITFISVDILIKRLSVSEEGLLSLLFRSQLFIDPNFINYSAYETCSLVKSIDQKSSSLLIKQLSVYFDTKTLLAIKSQLKSFGSKIDLKVGVQF